jgi:integrase
VASPVSLHGGKPAGAHGRRERPDRRHDRQTLSVEQLTAILEAARASDRTFRGLSGDDRHALYLTAMSTGFRASELSTLSPESFDLDADPPTATISSAYTKNRQTAVQPLPADALEVLRGYMDGKPAGNPLWPGTWAEDGAEMLRIDLEPAGVPYVIDGPDGPLYADLHALRHSFIAMLDQSGATLKQAMQLARHSDPKLTAARYGRARMNDLGAVLDRMPSLVASDSRKTESLQATGTDGAATDPQRLAFCLALPGRFSEAQMDADGRMGKESDPAEVLDSQGQTLVLCGESEVRPAGFEPATLGLGNRCSIP